MFSSAYFAYFAVQLGLKSSPFTSVPTLHRVGICGDILSFPTVIGRVQTRLHRKHIAGLLVHIRMIRAANEADEL